MEKGILFLHGLEAGINGEKGLFLRKNFKNCIYPDLEVSIYKIHKANSILRLILLNPIFICLISALTIFCYYICTKIGLIVGIPINVLLFVISLLLTKKFFIRKAVDIAMDNNIYVAYREIIKYNPKVLIGSSWGGAVALTLIKRGLWTGHTIVLAPAFYAVNKIIYNNMTDKIMEFQLKNLKGYGGKIIVYHSLLDNVIPFRDSEFLCENKQNTCQHFELRIIKDDNHSLKSLIGEPDYILKRDVEKLLNIF